MGFVIGEKTHLASEFLVLKVQTEEPSHVCSNRLKLRVNLVELEKTVKLNFLFSAKKLT